MTSPPQLPQSLSTLPIIAILRGCPYRHAAAVAGAAIEAGITVIEVTLDSERAFDQIEVIGAAHPSAELGAGSVLDPDEVTRSVDSGARFIVSPVVGPETISAALELGVPVIPGAATPTEIDRARRAGATAVKVFPIQVLGGPGYLRAVMSPLRSPPLIPTGGVDAGNAKAFLREGATAVGVGGSIFPMSALEGGDVDTVSRLVQEMIEAVG